MKPIGLHAYRREEGVALPVTLFALVVLALLVAALAGTTIGELESERLVDWDRRALYLAEAGVEHQIFSLKVDKNAPAVGTVSMGGSPLEGRYVVSLTCLPFLSAGGSCSRPESRTWQITSTGELWQDGTRVHVRTVEAVVEIRYCGGATNVKGCQASGVPPYGSPEVVLVHRWEQR